MERDRQQGKPIGRPKVTARQGFAEEFATLLERLDQGVISRRKAAHELDIGYAGLKRPFNAPLGTARTPVSAEATTCSPELKTIKFP